MGVGHAVTVAAVELWGSRVGAVSQDAVDAPAVFEYTTAFVRSGIELSPRVFGVQDPKAESR